MKELFIWVTPECISYVFMSPGRSGRSYHRPINAFQLRRVGRWIQQAEQKVDKYNVRPFLGGTIGVVIEEKDGNRYLPD